MNYLKFKNQSQINKSSTECFVKFNYKILSILCKIDCINDKYTFKKLIEYSTVTYPIAKIPIMKRYNIKIHYKPKLTMEQLCSNFGGLISMYFGLSMIDIAIFICGKILFKVIKMKISIVIKYLIKIFFLHNYVISIVYDNTIIYGGE